ncbi:hypothetical protein ABIE09_003408 [Lysobacter enzymogenes]|uniref:hypothetical protein n=1 Tax=Lysobacter enzymogenes TaxID=69 RepID=UPI003397171C
MHIPSQMIVVVAALALAACRQSSPSTEPSEQAQLASQRPASIPASDLAAVAELFASPKGRDWAEYDRLSNVAWIDPIPQRRAGRYSRQGKVLLLGFSETDIPNGKPGMEYAAVKRNEGESLLTAGGTATTVQSISISKPLYSDDYAGVLKRQFAPDAEISTIAQHCAANEYAEGAAMGAFYAIRLASGNDVYVQARQEDGGKYTAGFTVFEMTSTRPTQAIEAMNCKTLP